MRPKRHMSTLQDLVDTPAHLAEARRIAATRIAAIQRGKQARKSIKEEHEAASKIAAVHRGKAARRQKFVLAEAQHHSGRDLPSMISSTEPAKKLSLKQLGLTMGLPKNPVPELRFLTFSSWWTEMGTKRYVELCFDLESELFQVVLDKQVRVLDPLFLTWQVRVLVRIPTGTASHRVTTV